MQTFYKTIIFSDLG